MLTPASPGSTAARHPCTGISSRLQVFTTTDRIAATCGPACGLPTWIQFFRPTATGPVEFSAMLLLSSSTGWPRKRMSLVHSPGVYLIASPSMLDGSVPLPAAASAVAAIRRGPPLRDRVSRFGVDEGALRVRPAGGAHQLRAAGFFVSDRTVRLQNSRVIAEKFLRSVAPTPQPEIEHHAAARPTGASNSPTRITQPSSVARHISTPVSRSRIALCRESRGWSQYLPTMASLTMPFSTIHAGRRA